MAMYTIYVQLPRVLGRLENMQLCDYMPELKNSYSSDWLESRADKVIKENTYFSLIIKLKRLLFKLKLNKSKLQFHILSILSTT